MIGVSMIALVMTLTLVVWLIVKFIKSSRRNDCSRDDVSPESGYTQQEYPTRVFSIEELRQLDKSRFSWDENGLVFEINIDGSVSEVGHFDLSDLAKLKDLELFESIASNGLLEMLPTIWSFCEGTAYNEHERRFVMDTGGRSYMLSVPRYDGIDIATVFGDVELQESEQTALQSLIKCGAGIVILMPSNVRDFIMSLGAKAYLDRLFAGTIKTSIVFPSQIGAFAKALKVRHDEHDEITFMYGDNIECMESRLSNADGIYSVNTVRHIALRPNAAFALNYIANGALALSLVKERQIKDALLLPMEPYPMYFVLKDGDKTLKLYAVVTRPVSVPIFIRLNNNIEIMGGNKVAFRIGEYELIEDIVDQGGMILDDSSQLLVGVDIDTDLSIDIWLKSGHKEATINLGQLIG